MFFGDFWWYVSCWFSIERQILKFTHLGFSLSRPVKTNSFSVPRHPNAARHTCPTHNHLNMSDILVSTDFQSVETPTNELKRSPSEDNFFPTCQVRVVRFYVSLPFSFSSFRLRLLVLRLPSSSTAIRWDQCSAPDLNRDPVRSVFRAGPQPRSCEISVPCRTSTAIRWDQCSAPDLNHDPVRSVFRAGPQPRSGESSVPRRTSTAILWEQCSAPDLTREMCQKECQKIWQKKCQKICQKECQKICQKECQKICQIECQKICQKECQKICQIWQKEYMSERMSKDMSDRLSEDMSDRMSEDMSERMSEDMPERMSKDIMSERMSKDMPKRMSKDMS